MGASAEGRGLLVEGFVLEEVVYSMAVAAAPVAALAAAMMASVALDMTEEVRLTGSADTTADAPLRPLLSSLIVCSVRGYCSISNQIQ